MIKNKCLFYFLSLTWGLLMTIIGCLVASVLLLMGYKPKRWGYCYYFEIGNGWGGLELGPFFLTSKNPSIHTRNHEHGHAFQGCWLGPFMLFIVCIPSATRYWYRKIRRATGNPCNTEYDDIWFERSASSLGKEFIDWYNTQQND